MLHGGAGRGAVWIAFCVSLTVAGCTERVGPGALTLGVAFETLQTEFWVASFEAMKADLAKRGIRLVEAIADGDSNRQFEQVRNFIALKVDGIIVVPKDAHTVIPMIREANAAKIPIVLYNRPPAESDARSVSIVADNYAIAKATVECLVGQARRSGGKHKAMILVGDLGDINSVGRRDGFEDVISANADVVEVVARVPTEWSQEKALAGVTNGLQANPDTSLIFSSSDLLLPSVVSALKGAGKYRKVGEPGHVILGSFDGDATAYSMLVDGYLDADGVQDAYFETSAAIQAVLDLREGRPVPSRIEDKGLVIHQGNLKEAPETMWGARFEK